MLRSESRILTTHAGSLPRPRALAQLHGRRSRGEDVDPAELRQAVEDATAASPGIVAAAMENRHYASREEYVHAVAAALGTEYRAIVERGLLLQIDAPDLAMERHTLFADRPLADFLEWVELVIRSINGALDGVPPEDVRLHVCWGNYEGPHTHDVALDDILPLLYEARVGALVVSMA